MIVVSRTSEVTNIFVVVSSVARNLYSARCCQYRGTGVPAPWRIRLGVGSVGRRNGDVSSTCGGSGGGCCSATSARTNPSIDISSGPGRAMPGFLQIPSGHARDHHRQPEPAREGQVLMEQQP